MNQRLPSGPKPSGDDSLLGLVTQAWAWLGISGRILVIAVAADVLIAVGGKYVTLTEIAAGLNAGKRVIGLGTWEIEGVEKATSAREAVSLAMRE